eukprot:7787753-Pyramimonas_sp.AAC.1
MSRGDPRRTYLCWPSQKPTKVATVSQIAAPPGTARSRGDLRMTYLRCSQETTKVATASQIAAPQGTARSRGNPRRTCPRYVHE